MTPYSHLTGETTDISHLCNFAWYEWVKYRKTGEETGFPSPTERLGRCLGPANNKGHIMSQYVLTDAGEVIPIQTLRKLTQSELDGEHDLQQRKAFDESIRKRFGDHKAPPDNWVRRRRRPGDDVQYDDPDYSNERDSEVNFPYVDQDGNIEHELPEQDEINDLDLYVGAEVLLPHGVNMQAATVIGRARDGRGNPIGQYDSNPILDSRVYDVMFPDGAIQQYASNIIAESILSTVDDDGFRYQTFDEINAHRRLQNAIEKKDGYIVNQSGQKRRVQTTKGWEIQIRWTDGQYSWLPLKDVKDSYPLELAEYAQSHDLLSEPAFAWWVPHVLKKRKNIISSVKARMKKRTNKYGIQIPTTIMEAYELDRINGNDFWRKAIEREMNNVKAAFKYLDSSEAIPVGYGKMTLHMIFDVKLDLTRKARLVADGHKAPEPVTTTYAGVVSRESVRIALTYAALMGLDVFGADIQNAFITAPTSEKFWIECGPEFGSEMVGTRALIKRALYGMKSACRDFRNHLRDCMSHLEFEPCQADPDLWMRIARDNSGREYYEYMLLYVDDCLVVSHQPDTVLNKLGKYFTLKPSSVGTPNLYLGAKMAKITLPNGVSAWGLSASKYVQESVRNVEKELNKRNVSLAKNINAPIITGYQPEIDMTPECDDVDAKLYMSLIGILRWIVEMGRIDIAVEVSMLSSYCMMPREGQLSQVFRIFGYLKSHHNSRLVLDPTYPEIDEEEFVKRDWKQFYGDISEELPPGRPRPLGKEFIIRAFVDADFAGDKLTRRSRTGFIVMLNNAPIFWFTKKQTSAETSSFGSEFVALKQCCEYLKSLRYKLRMMGMYVNNPCFVYGDNQSVLWNTTVPDSMLKKKTSSVAYHFVREGVSKDCWRTAYIKSMYNPADLLTKALSAGINRYRKVRQILYDIFPISNPKFRDKTSENGEC